LNIGFPITDAKTNKAIQQSGKLLTNANPRSVLNKISDTIDISIYKAINTQPFANRSTIEFNLDTHNV